MDIKRLMFLKAMSGGEVKECAPNYFSADSGSTPSTTNSYGTTINTTSATDNEVEVTQVYNSGYQPTSYRNGFVCVGFDKLKEWANAGKHLYFDADIDISANPAEVTDFQCYIYSRDRSPSITGGKIHVDFGTFSSEINKTYVEIRCCGCSFTLSNCKLSIE